MILPFTKASACGNDFLIVDGDESLPNIAGLTRRMCDRHYGVGGDGVEWLFAAQDADVEARLINGWIAGGDFGERDALRGSVSVRAEQDGVGSDPHGRRVEDVPAGSAERRDLRV